MMEERNLDQRIAEQVSHLRAARGLTLDQLAARSGVSRSMISLIERGESSPTAALLERLAGALGVPLARLFDARGAAPAPVSRRAEQARWRDPDSGYVRRNVSPAGIVSPIHIVEVVFPAGAKVGFDAVARDVIVHQQIWVLEGSMDVLVGQDSYQLGKGDCLAFVLDRPTVFRNRARKAARYALVVVGQPERAR